MVHYGQAIFFSFPIFFQFLVTVTTQISSSIIMTHPLTINHLPNELLLNIFNNLNQMEDLVNCSKVSCRWQFVVQFRLRRVKYLMKVPYKGSSNDRPRESYENDVAYYWMDIGDRNKPLQYQKLLPNLRIVEVRTTANYTDRQLETIESLSKSVFRISSKRQNTVGKIFKSQSNVIGLIYQPCMSGLAKCDLSRLEMLSISNHGDWTNFSFFRKINCLRQLSIFIYHQTYRPNLLLKILVTFPYIQRLHIDDPKGLAHYGYIDSKVPINPYLRILEVERSWTNYPFSSLLSHFPNLESLHLLFRVNKTWSVDEDLEIFPNLKNLVIDFAISLSWDQEPLEECDSFVNLLSFFPNLKKLAIRNHPLISHRHIKMMLRKLPSIETLDLRGCPYINLSEQSLLSYLSQPNRKPLNIYILNLDEYLYGPFPVTQNHTRLKQISKGFDFMANCFYRSFFDLPSFLIQSDH